MTETVDFAKTQQADYFSFQHQQEYMLPDGVSYVILKKMNEGEKKKYQQMIRPEVTMQRGSGDTKMRLDAATERHALLDACVVGWNLSRQGQPVPFDKDERTGRKGQNWRDFLELADPKLIEDIERECRKLNPWLLQDMSVEDIDREIENLQEMRVAALEREQGN